MNSFPRFLCILSTTTLLGCGARVINVVVEEDAGADIRDASEEPGLRDAWLALDCGWIDRIPAGLARIGTWTYDPETKEFTLPEACGQIPAPSRGTRRISVDTFWLDQNPMTNSCYEECVVRGVCTPPEHDRADPNSYSWLDKEKAEYPVYVTHEQATQFCAWRGGSLPTLAQLARAAQGDSDIPGVTELTLAQIRCHEGTEPDLDLCRRLDWITIPPSNPYPVMTADYDVGPFGTRDIHGSITEWTRADIHAGSPEFCALEDGAPDSTSFSFEPGRNQYSAVYFAHGINYAFDSPTRDFYFGGAPAITVSYRMGFRCAFSEEEFARALSDPGPWPW